MDDCPKFGTSSYVCPNAGLGWPSAFRGFWTSPAGG